MKTRGVLQLRPEQCSRCSKDFPWSESGSTQLFPLLCGHIFCRVCLAQSAREVLSSTKAPLLCCNKVVSSDYVREVLAHEENVYYSFLLSSPRTSGDAANKANRTTDMKVAAGSTPAGSSTQKTDGGDLEMKLRPSTLVLDAFVTTTVGQGDFSSSIASASPAGPRYVTRSSKARLAKQQVATPGEAGTASARASSHQLSATTSGEKLCKCRGPYVSSTKAPCGHGVCRNCLGAAVRGYLAMAPYGNAVPVSCCNKALPLELVGLVISGREWTAYAKYMYKSTDTTTPSTVGSKRKAAPEEKPAAVSQKAKGKAPVKRAKKTASSKDDCKRECASCFEKFLPAKLRVGPCGHGYCLPCLKTMTKLSLSNRNNIPVRCCSKELPIDYVKTVLTKTQFEQYQRYVSERDPKTSTLKSDKEYATVVRKNKGKQCPVCGIGVVKVSGCHAMRCSLGHGFCWNCLQTICTCGRIYQYH